jgi:hypothetical protein
VLPATDGETALHHNDDERREAEPYRLPRKAGISTHPVS